jgi:hypothetical protein
MYSFKHVVSVSPSDSELLSYPLNSGEGNQNICTSALVVGASGNVKVKDYWGNTTTFYAVAGFVYPVCVQQVFATGTAATGIVALW